MKLIINLNTFIFKYYFQYRNYPYMEQENKKENEPKQNNLAQQSECITSITENLEIKLEHDVLIPEKFEITSSNSEEELINNPSSIDPHFIKTENNKGISETEDVLNIIQKDFPTNPRKIPLYRTMRNNDMENREKLIKQLEEKRNSKIIIISHVLIRSNLIPFLDTQGKLTKDEALSFVETINSNPDKTIDLILDTNGGSLSAAEVIINAILNHKHEIRVYIPRYATSAGTLIALSSNKIYLGKNAYMGSIDPQYAFGYSVGSILKYQKEIDLNNTMQSDKIQSSWVNDLIKLISIDADSSIKWVESIISKICTVRKNLNSQDIILNLLNHPSIIHERPLFFQNLSKIFPCEEGIPEELSKLLESVLKKND